MQYAPEKHGESHLEPMGLRRPLFVFPTRAGKYDDNVACQRHHLQTLSEIFFFTNGSIKSCYMVVVLYVKDIFQKTKNYYLYR